MNKILSLLFISFSLFSCAQENQTTFKPEALQNKMMALDGSTITFNDILNKYKGKTIVIDVWASWCSDCIKGMPKVKTLQSQFPNVTYLFVSMDKTSEAWKNGIQKHEVSGEHYMTTDGMKGVFGKAIDLNWIPRYMVIDKKGTIALFRAIEADDIKLIETLNTIN
jgi:thiol-disulfide isomerase/thioredoxin